MTLGMRGLKIVLAAMTVLGAAATLIFWWSPSIAADPAATGQAVSAGIVQWGLLAAAIATGLSSLGAGIAVASVGSAAIGALAEKPELIGRTLIFVGLAEGIAIYGLIISILILNRIT